MCLKELSYFRAIGSKTARRCATPQPVLTRYKLREIARGLFTAQDCMTWELDAPVPPLPSLEAFPGPKGRYSTILRIIATEHPTVRQLLGRLAAGGGHCTVVGTPEQIADQMEHWFVHEGADGFNLMPPVLPDGLEDFVEQVVPVLQRRGLFRTAYESATLRGHLGLERP